MKRFLKCVKWVACVLAGLISLILISLLMYGVYQEKSTKIETPNGIESLEEITLGGIEQWIFVRGTDRENPVLIFLHGGPGAPAPGISSARRLDAELIKHFTVVHWDQRGTGKSYDENIPIASMTYDRMVEDCNELINYLRNKLNQEKIYIVGHSAGSIIGMKTAQKYPEKIRAYVGVGQLINEYEQKRVSYNFILEEAEKCGDEKIQNELKASGPPPYETPERDLEIAAYIFKYGGVIHYNGVRQIMTLMLGFLTSPEYSLSDGIRMFRNSGLLFTMKAMWEEIKNVDLSKEIQSIEVPVYFFVGKYDMATPMVLVEDFFNELDAPKGKKFIIFENSAHFPMIEEKKKYEQVLINVVLKECQDK